MASELCEGQRGVEDHVPGSRSQAQHAEVGVQRPLELAFAQASPRAQCAGEVIVAALEEQARFLGLGEGARARRPERRSECERDQKEEAKHSEHHKPVLIGSTPSRST